MFFSLHFLSSCVRCFVEVSKQKLDAGAEGARWSSKKASPITFTEVATTPQTTPQDFILSIKRQILTPKNKRRSRIRERVLHRPKTTPMGAPMRPLWLLATAAFLACCNVGAQYKYNLMLLLCVRGGGGLRRVSVGGEHAHVAQLGITNRALQILAPGFCNMLCLVQAAAAEVFVPLRWANNLDKQTCAFPLTLSCHSPQYSFKL